MTTSAVPMPRAGFAAGVAANVRAEMARHGVTQGQVAAVLGLPQSAVSRRAHGRIEWGLAELEAIAPLLRTTASRLCAIRDSNPEPADSEPAEVIALADWRREHAPRVTP